MKRDLCRGRPVQPQHVSSAEPPFSSKTALPGVAACAEPSGSEVGRCPPQGAAVQAKPLTVSAGVPQYGSQKTQATDNAPGASRSSSDETHIMAHLSHGQADEAVW